MADEDVVLKMVGGVPAAVVQPKKAATEELSGLLKDAGLVPYFHDQDCAMWRGGECDRYCGPPVCPGCYAVGPERCAPDCIDEEIRQDAEREAEMSDHRYGDEDDDD